jgi:uroporphyrinogen decarboxylase
LQKLVDIYHQADRLVVLHSCGNVTPLINDLLEIGIDVLDPLQPACNQLGYIRQKTAGRMCLSGGVTTSILQAEDTARTIEDTQQRIDALGADGGYIVGPDNDWNQPSAARSAMLAVVSKDPYN